MPNIIFNEIIFRKKISGKLFDKKKRKKIRIMSKKDKTLKDKELESQQEENKTQETEKKQVETEKTSEKLSEEETSEEEMTEKKEEIEVSEENKIEELENKIAELNDKYIRLAAEYDNYRRRTLKEKMELIKNGGEDVLKSILPVIDNFERALKAIEESSDIDAVKEGIELIYSNFTDFLKQKGIVEIEAKDKTLDTDLHEAVAQIPAQDEESKGKIIDVIEKGYKINDKVLRFAKVVVAQ